MFIILPKLLLSIFFDFMLTPLKYAMPPEPAATVDVNKKD